MASHEASGLRAVLGSGEECGGVRKVVTLQLLGDNKRCEESRGQSTFLKATRTNASDGQSARKECLWTLESSRVDQGSDLLDVSPLHFTVEQVGEARQGADLQPALVLRSVSAGGKAISLASRRKGKRRVVFLNTDEDESVVDDSALWLALEGSGDAVTLASKVRPETRMGPIRLRSLKLTLDGLLGREGSPGLCEAGAVDAAKDEEASLVRDAREVVEKLESLIRDKGKDLGASGSPIESNFVPKVRPKPRRGSTWMACVDTGEVEDDSGPRARSRALDVGPNSRGTLVEGERRPRIADAAHSIPRSPLAEDAPTESEIPAPKVRAGLPVPLQQNILAQIRQGVKLRRNQKTTAVKGEPSDAGANTHMGGAENCPPHMTPTPMSNRRNSGLMSELRRSLAGRRKSMGEGSPNNGSETEESCNWSPLSVNT